MGNLCQAASKMAATFPVAVSLPDASTVSLCECAKELAAAKRINFLLIDDIGFAFDGTEYPDKQRAVEMGISRACHTRRIPGKTNFKRAMPRKINGHRFSISAPKGSLLSVFLCPTRIELQQMARNGRAQPSGRPALEQRKPPQARLPTHNKKIQ